MTSAEDSQAAFLLLLIHCLLLPPLCCGEFMVGPCFVVHYFVSIFAIISLGKKVNCWRYLNCLLISFDSYCSVPLPGLQCVIVAFPSHTHLLFHVIFSDHFF